MHLRWKRFVCSILLNTETHVIDSVTSQIELSTHTAITVSEHGTQAPRRTEGDSNSSRRPQHSEQICNRPQDVSEYHTTTLLNIAADVFMRGVPVWLDEKHSKYSATAQTLRL